MFKRKWTPLTKEEQYAAEEIIFHVLINRLFKQYEDTVVVLDMIDALCIPFKCNRSIILNAAIKSTQHTPSRSIMIVLLYKANLPMMYISKLLRTSTKTLYQVINTYKADPYPIDAIKYSLVEHREIIVFLKEFNALKELI